MPEVELVTLYLAAELNNDDTLVCKAELTGPLVSDPGALGYVVAGINDRVAPSAVTTVRLLSYDSYVRMKSNLPTTGDNHWNF